MKERRLLRVVPGISEPQAALLSHSLEFRFIAPRRTVLQEANCFAMAEWPNPLACRFRAGYALTVTV
jgi:hypothetical protein